MKKRTLAILAAIAIAASISLTACGGATEDNGKPAENDSKAVASEIRADESSSAAESEATSETSSQQDSDQSEESFEKKFSENPLDAAYNAQMDAVTTNLDMINTTTTFAGLWNDEVNHAFDLLLKATDGSAKAAVEKQKEQWEDELESKLQDIAESVTGDGSAIRLERAMRVKDFYRTQAMNLYEQLYQYDKDFTYIYAPY